MLGEYNRTKIDFDFTLIIYRNLLKNLQEQAFSFLPYRDFNFINFERAISLRHDVDLSPLNSLKFARIQFELGIQGTYYFRTVPESWNDKVIREIHELNHEVGYHYECLTTTKGNIKAAIKDFEVNLKKFRKLVPVYTICMHGSPMSKYDNSYLWKHYDYHDFGIIGEPYIDTNFSQVAYYTDTGRMWDGKRYSVRDKVSDLHNKENISSQDISFPKFHTTRQMIDAIQYGTFPRYAMLTFHPQRWNNQALPWLKEYIWQHSKNIIKYFIIRLK